MLRHTFQHLPGIRDRGERRLWLAGKLRWSDLTDYCPSRVEKSEFELALDKSEEAWDQGDAAWFGNNLPSREAWRLFHRFHEHAAYLDIETTGSSQSMDAVTCIAVAVKDGVRTFVKGRNLDAFPDAICDTPLLVTFNGQTFDLPFLRGTFGVDVFANHAHFDVCIALRRLGYRGGLKRLERELGVPRDSGLDGVDGSLAVDLWQRHQRGDERALPTLERYCAEDVLGLPALAGMATNFLLEETPFTASLGAVPVRRRIESYLPYSSSLVGECLAARQAFGRQAEMS